MVADSPKDHRDQATDVQMLKFGDDAFRAGKPKVVDPVIAVPVRPPISNLPDPGLDIFRLGVDRNGAGRIKRRVFHDAVVGPWAGRSKMARRG